jgi:lipopolysaccharide biosynthesis glycosyltransferase
MNNCIFTAFDDKYFIYARAWLTSLAENYPDHPPVKIIYVGKNEGVKDFCSSLPNVSILDYPLDPHEFEGLNLGVVGSPMIYVRLVLWTRLFDEYDSIVYMDCDTVVLKPFPEVFLFDDFFCVSDNSKEEVILQQASSDAELMSYLETDKIVLEELNRSMLNSGFFVLPKKYRTRENLDQLWGISRKYNKFMKHSDQSILSIWCYINRLSISNAYEYNFQTHFIFSAVIHSISMDSIKIIHYSYWKPRRNFEQLLLPASYVLKAHEAFEKYADMAVQGYDS